MTRTMLPLTAALAMAGLLTMAGAQPAHAVAGRCMLQVRGRVLIDGPCQPDVDRQGGFSFDVKDANGAQVSVSIFPEGSRATGLITVVSWKETAYNDMGSLRRDGSCWVGPNVRACAAAASRSR